MKLFRFLIITISLAGLLFASCKKEVADKFIIDAGPSLSRQLPLDTVTLTGNIVSGGTASLHFLWSYISGPNTPNITATTQIGTLVSNLVAGTYVFQFQATNSNGITAVDTISVTVLPLTLKTLTLQPTANTSETDAYTYTPNGLNPQPTTLPVQAWTVNSVPQYSRAFIKFDLSQLPSNATIVSASFSLYSLTQAEFTNYTGATYAPQYGNANACYAQRITSSWASNTLTWNNMPKTTTVNEATLPQTSSPEENATNIDVTNLVQDMQQYGNNGFAVRLVNEIYYNARQFASSNDPDAAKHPKLVINYY